MLIPRELLDYKQWVLWKRISVEKRVTKVPISPWSGKPAACDQPQTWSTYKHVRYVQRRWQCDGIGFVFTANDPFCGIDLDNCRINNGDFTAEARGILQRLHSFSELSPSGRGLHILVKAKLPAGRRRRNGLEIYDAGRYFTITGWHIEGTPTIIAERQQETMQLHSELGPTVSVSITPAVHLPLSLSDRDLIEKAQHARSGPRFSRLWAGDLSDYDGDHSRADAALCCMLAFWTQQDAVRMDHLFRCSGLMREKWNRHTGNSTYGARTIQIALQNKFLSRKGM